MDEVGTAISKAEDLYVKLCGVLLEYLTQLETEYCNETADKKIKPTNVVGSIVFAVVSLVDNVIKTLSIMYKQPEDEIRTMILEMIRNCSNMENK